jgi:hypothetical protein
MKRVFLGVLLAAATAAALKADGVGFFFSTNPPDGKMAMASRPPGNGKIEIEAADDFFTTSPVAINGASFVGLVTPPSTVSQVVVAIYHVFPTDSDTVRTPNVVTRANSPSDSEFVSRDSSAGELTFTTAVVTTTFTAGNSVLNGINPKPNQTTNGEGPVTGQEVQFNVTFTPPILLDAGHFFFVPQVLLTSASAEFYWLSAPKPIVAPGTPFPVGTTDLQTWMRNANLDPDWSRVGTDIEGLGRTFNGTFALSGAVLELSPAHLWIGLKNSDDQGTQFDLMIELLKNGTPVASGLERCITGVTRNPLKATEAIVPFDSGPSGFASGDILSLRVSTRIGTNPDDTKCAGPGGSHNNAVGLRLYYDSTNRPSRFDTNLLGTADQDVFLHSDGNPCANAPSTGVTNLFLDVNAPTSGDAKCRDSGKLNFAGGNAFSTIGTWSMTFP